VPDGHCRRSRLEVGSPDTGFEVLFEVTWITRTVQMPLEPG